MFDDHVAALMFDGTASSGRYVAPGWQVSAVQSAQEPVARMVTLHESMHAALNESTAWGGLFMAFAELVRHNPIYRDMCMAWVDACRKTHEMFATYTGVFLADAAAGTGLLSAYPDYLGHHATAIATARGLPDGSLVQWYAVLNVARVCMQGDVLDTALRIGLPELRMRDMRSANQPDHRLRLLLEAATAGLWDDLVSRIGVRCADLPGWDRAARVLVATPHVVTEDEYDDAVSAVLATASQMCTEIAADALVARGIAALEYDGHRAWNDQLVGHIHDIVPDSPITAVGEGTLSEQMSRTFAGERLVLRDRPLTATIQPFTSVPRRERRSRVTDWSAPFVVARMAGALREQYGPDLLPDVADTTPVVAAERSARPNEPEQVRLWSLKRPRELRPLRELVANISMHVLAEPGWEDRWLPALRRAGRVTLLLDAEPFIHFDHWLSLGLSVRFASVRLGGSDQEWAGFVCECDDPSLARVPFVTVCSHVTRDFLINFLRTKPAGFAQEDTSIVTDRPHLFQVVFAHLLDEQTFFTFDRLPLARSE